MWILVFILFTLSGFCSLLYQIVWLRLAFAHFGVITPVISLVLSTFMLGLALGSWGAARLLGKLRSHALAWYAGAEIIIGVGAFSVPPLFVWGERVLLAAGSSNSETFLFFSGLIIGGSILPWCVAMGTTLPFMMAFLERRSDKSSSSFSFLYLANVIGATIGVLATSGILIEEMGFKNTLKLGGSLNFFLAVVALLMNGALKKKEDRSGQSDISSLEKDRSKGEKTPLSASLVLFVTGFVSVGIEVALTRVYTPLIGTTVYAFALILALYLLATSIGSLIYRTILKTWWPTGSGFLYGSLVIAVLLTVLNSDVRFKESETWAVLGSFPLFLLLGILTPAVIDQSARGSARIAGTLYAMNAWGCILGPLVTGYFLLPHLGAKYSLIILSVPFLCFLPSAVTFLDRSSRLVLIGLIAFSFLIAFRSHNIEEGPLKYDGEKIIRRDHAATVISYTEARTKALIVNGIPITILTNLTKVMAHLPLSCLSNQPESGLVICFGMGTTYRSLLSWGIKATAVELVPSVVEAFDYYYEDAAEIRKNPQGTIIIDDGRRFLQRSKEQFDVITIDPPPPVEAAASSLLYSTEFYALAKSRLKENGILQQWFPNGEYGILLAVARSLATEFPHIRVFRPWFGYYFLASRHPIQVPTLVEWLERLPAAAKRDLVELDPRVKIEDFYPFMFGKEMQLAQLLRNDPSLIITDDRPYNEYYFLRRHYKQRNIARPHFHPTAKVLEPV